MKKKQQTLSRDEHLSNKRKKLYKIKEQQKSLKQIEKGLKSEIIQDMGNRQVHKDANGTIEKISRKPKRIYDSDKLRAVLIKRGMPEEAVEEIINKSTRHMNVGEHLSVKVKRPK